MSQEKVARYKEQKAKRKETVKKQKRARFVRNSIAGIVFVAVIGWVGYSAVAYYIENPPRLDVEVNYDAIDDYMEQIQTTAEE